MAGALEKSSEVMKYMQQLIKIPEINATMQEMSKEMMKVQCIIICVSNKISRVNGSSEALSYCILFIPSFRRSTASSGNKKIFYSTVITLYSHYSTVQSVTLITLITLRNP